MSPTTATHCGGVLTGVRRDPAGILVATAIDSSVLAWDEPEPLRDASETDFRITPTFAPSEGGASVGVVGVF